MERTDSPVRNLVLVLGDQLNVDSAAFDNFDNQRDAVWMAEVASEADHVWSHQARIALFLSAMRHFRSTLERQDIRVDYRQLDDDAGNRGNFAAELADALKRLRPERLVMVQPGAWRVEELFRASAAQQGIALDIRQDRHFLCSREEFREHAQGRKQLRLEYFYREMRRRHNILLDAGRPCGDKWNWDAENRSAFPKSGPAQLRTPRTFRPNALTQKVLRLVSTRFGDHPGQLEHFGWPVTTRQAKQALDDFIKHRLPLFGQYQDAMWAGEPYLFHSRLSAALNLKLLDPLLVVRSAEAAYRAGAAPLNAVEGFIRQILGWREYVRGIYWLYMPEYLERNALHAEQPLPKFYWTGETEMQCLRETIRQTLNTGYAHHIQRLMVTGLFALLLGVQPRQIHRWYLAVYVDAVEWVELPNTLGMSQFADGGVMASKPYAATGKYIQRMSNYCANCRFRPNDATGDLACPFTTLYWDFLDRHQKLLKQNQRMTLQLKNLERLTAQRRRNVRQQAARLRERFAG